MHNQSEEIEVHRLSAAIPLVNKDSIHDLVPCSARSSRQQLQNKESGRTLTGCSSQAVSERTQLLRQQINTLDDEIINLQANLKKALERRLS
jgi:septal ring factor EnvC (AmiA/AmiB activator)